MHGSTSPFLSSYPAIAGQGQRVLFGAAKDEKAPPAAPAATAPEKDQVDIQSGKDGDKSKAGAAKQTDSQKKSGSSSIRESGKFLLGAFFQFGAPIALAFCSFGFIPGMIIGTIGSYISGKIGKRLLTNVDHAKLGPITQQVKNIQEMITGEKSIDGGKLPNAVNNLYKNLLEVPLSKYPRIKEWLLKKLMLNPNGPIAKLLSGVVQIRLNMFQEVAAADNLKDAARAAKKQGWESTKYHWLFPKIGSWLSHITTHTPWFIRWPANGIAWILKFFPWGRAIVSGGNQPKPA